MSEPSAFERIAMAAAPIFLARGYDGVGLRALAKELGIKAASLYHHCPDGKSELYARALTTYLGDYQSQLASARGRARFPAALHRMTDWMLDHPPVDPHAVLAAPLSDDARDALIHALHAAVVDPIADVFRDAQAKGQVRAAVQPELAASAVISLVHGLGFSHLHGPAPEAAALSAARDHVRQGVSLLLDGVRGDAR